MVLLYLNNRSKMKKIILLTIMTISVCNSFAQIALSSIFTDNMVLQRNSTVDIWGYSASSVTVEIVAEWLPQDTIRVQSAPTGRWEAKLKTNDRRGAFSIQFKDNDSDTTLNNVVLGEVWLCSGQSNMQWTANDGIFDAQQHISQANAPDIRIFNIPLRTANTPQNECDAQWEVCTPQIMANTSAIAYLFAKRLKERLDVPVGIIVSAWGGTPAEVWTPKELIEESDVLKENAAGESSLWWPIDAGVAWNQMIHPIVPYRIKGVLWYQGEANCGNYNIYGNLQKTMIEAWRERFNNDFPFYFVQIAPFNYGYGKSRKSSFLREQQQMVDIHVPNTEMVVVSDKVEDINNIHPMDKQAVAQRLANIALSDSYNITFDKEVKSPTFKSIKIVGNKATIALNNCTNVECSQDEVAELEIAGEDGVFHKAQAKLKGNIIIAWSSKVKNPTMVHYCFDDDAIGNLFSESKLPVAPFRSECNHDELTKLWR